jgi:adenine specific DNA methylase Mod
LVFTVYSIALDRIEEITEILQKTLLQKFPQSEKVIHSTTQQFLTESLNAAIQLLKKHVLV